MTKPERKPVDPLKTRHIFLDTEVYRRAGFNLKNTQFEVLRKHIQAGHAVLHTSDITLAEIARQIREIAAEKAADAKRLAKDFERLAQLQGHKQDYVKTIDGVALGDAAWKGFVEIISSQLRSHSVLALQLPARKVFDRYFAMLPPFDRRGSKEFPDAFVVEALAHYCRTNDINMYVVSGDAALRASAADHGALLPLESLDEVLASVAATDGADYEGLVETLFESPRFDKQLFDAIDADISFMELTYIGTLENGALRNARIKEIVAVDDYRLVSIDDGALGLILQVYIELEAELRYLDFDEMRDGDDDVIPTTLETCIRTSTHINIFVSVDTSTFTFKETELLTLDLFID